MTTQRVRGCLKGRRPKTEPASSNGPQQNVKFTVCGYSSEAVEPVGFKAAEENEPRVYFTFCSDYRNTRWPTRRQVHVYTASGPRGSTEHTDGTTTARSLCDGTPTGPQTETLTRQEGAERHGASARNDHGSAATLGNVKTTTSPRLWAGPERSKEGREVNQ